MSRRWIFSMILGGMFVVGCEQAETPAPAPPPAAPAMPDVPAVPGAAADTAKETAGAATQVAADAGSAASAEAQKLLDQVTTYIKENKMDLAEKALTQVEGMKASLPAAMQDKVASARKAFDTAKAAGLVAPR